MTATVSTGLVHSLIPARLDRLRWTPFHSRLVMALGVAWVLDGLEITIAGSVGGVLGNADTLSRPRPPSEPWRRSIWSARWWGRSSSGGSPTGSGDATCSW